MEVTSNTLPQVVTLARAARKPTGPRTGYKSLGLERLEIGQAVQLGARQVIGTKHIKADPTFAGKSFARVKVDGVSYLKRTK